MKLALSKRGRIQHLDLGLNTMSVPKSHHFIRRCLKTGLVWIREAIWESQVWLRSATQKKRAITLKCSPCWMSHRDTPFSATPHLCYSERQLLVLCCMSFPNKMSSDQISVTDAHICDSCGVRRLHDMCDINLIDRNHSFIFTGARECEHAGKKEAR